MNELKNIIIIIITIIITIIIIIIIIIIKASSFKIAEIKNVAILCVIKVAPVKHDAWFMFHSLQCTMVNPFVAGSSVLFTFIEIMETILKKLLKRVNNLWEGVWESFQLRWLRKLLTVKHKRAEAW